MSMKPWRVEYVMDAAGDSPIPKKVDVEIDTEGLDVYGADQEKVVELLRQAAIEAGRKVGHINSAYPIDEAADQS